MLFVYAATIFLSAALLFLVQPMFARMALPLLGGSPGVWNTAMVFYQATLLLGYGYAHVTMTRLGVRRQAVLHLVLLLLPLSALPIGIASGWTPPTSANPIPWLLLLMTVAVGAPFFVVSTSSPVLQRWFAATGHPAAADPYFLYAASNAGSMLALLAYPVLLEPRLELVRQSRLWAVGYLLLVVLFAGCAWLLWRASKAPPVINTAAAGAAADAPEESDAGLTRGQRLRWVLLSFVPSSLMLSVTTHLSTDVAPVPLLWIIPLALYLLTFILVFARRPLLPQALLVRAMPVTVVALALILAMRSTQPLFLLIALHLISFFVIAMVCHGEIARHRPPTRHLTEFYLWMSVGGVLGGIFNALLAPLLFSAVAEYPLTLVLACLLAPRPEGMVSTRRQRLLDGALPLALGLLTVGLTKVVGVSAISSGQLALASIFGPPVLLAFFASRRPVRFGLGIAAILAAGSLWPLDYSRALYVERSFFGVHRVTQGIVSANHFLIHGSTQHGMQSRDPARRREPLTYYYRTGPIGQMFAALPVPAQGSVAVVGLGTGTLAAYGKKDQRWTFFEIDPAVERIARNPAFFTYLQDSSADIEVTLGDARLSLARSARKYDRIILDAYSSDAVPIHLITREALALYMSRLKENGVVAFHISNRHLDLEPVLAGLARDAGLICLIQRDMDIAAAESAAGKSISVWAIMARNRAHLGALAQDRRWTVAREQPNMALWTDNYSSIFRVFNWH